MAIDESTRVLVVADWTVEATDVVAECRRRAEADGALFILMLPGWVHGLDWGGDRGRRALRAAAARDARGLRLEAGIAVEIA